MKGGARVNSGPLPKDPAARRRRNLPAQTSRVLPAEGYQGPLPEWPLGRCTKSVASVWERLWRKPQAAAWVDLGYEFTVARLALLMVQAVKPGVLPAILSEVRQIEDRLGLNPAAMQRLRWEVDGGEQADVVQLRVATGADSRRPPRAVDE